MKITIVSDWFSEMMGYSENFLPKALASLGAEVHVVTSNVQPYFNSPIYRETYEPYIGPGIVDTCKKQFDGYLLHRLPIAEWRGRLRINGMVNCIREIHPDIVQTFDVFCPTTFELTIAKSVLGYKLFHESHIHASVFPALSQRASITKRLKWFAYKSTFGRFISLRAEKCYPISIDAAEIVTKFFGFEQNKIEICSLGVDTDLFTPIDRDEERQQLRKKFGFSSSDIVCIYTGRFSNDKGPIILAQAIHLLVEKGLPFRGLFVGNGSKEEIRAIRSLSGCVIQSFVPVHELPKYYRTSDVGVWPKQESTSQLDAAACGLPLILSNKVKVLERVEGNGLLYEEGDPEDLARQIIKLMSSNTRKGMGQIGVEKIKNLYSWQLIAKKRLHDYAIALRR